MLAAAARKAGHPVIPLNLPKQHDKDDKARRFTLHDIGRDLQHITVIFQLLRVLEEQQIDLIHANSLAAGLIGGVAAKLYGVPIVMHKRYATAYGVLDRICEALLDRVILVSEATRWRFAPPSKQVLIYNGVELSAFQPSSQVERQRNPDPIGMETLRADLNLDPDAVLIGIVTRITPEKGIHTLIEATAKLKASPQYPAACCRRSLLSQRCGIYRFSEGTGGEVGDRRSRYLHRLSGRYSRDPIPPRYCSARFNHPGSLPTHHHRSDGSRCTGDRHTARRKQGTGNTGNRTPRPR